MEVLISMPSPVVRFNNTGFQAEMRLETAYIYCTYHAKIWGLFSFSIIGALVVGFWTCTAWTLANFPFPCPVVFSAFFFFCYFPWYKKKDPNGWHACPVKLIWVSQWWGLAWFYLAEIYHALAHLLPSYLLWLVLVCGIILLLFSILLTHCRTLLYISPSTYKYSQWWHQVYYVDQNRIVGYVPYMLNGEWPGFDSPDSPADIFDFKVYLRPQNSLAIGATIPRHFTRIINSNADVVFCFLVLASRYGWYDIRLDFCFTNSLWGCS